VLEIGDLPVEEHTLLTARHARLMLDCGFTSCISAASAKPRLDIVIRNEQYGPAAGTSAARSIAGTDSGGLVDVRQLQEDYHSTELIADGPDELRRVVRT
jgi:hypothetical protein